jgi:hypothetical protein
VPANPGALVSRETAEIAMKTIGPKCVELVQTKSLGEKFLVLPSGPDDPEELDLGKGKPGTTYDNELDASLAKVIEMARTVKAMGQGAHNEARKSLLMTAIDVLKEAVQDSPEEVSGEQILALKDVLVALAGLTTELAPEASSKIQTTISQIDKALAGRQAA